ncbi:MAG: PRC-barrel domain-containing protein [Gemmatimonadota bacterium]
MLHSAGTMSGYKLHAKDGNIGQVKEFFFDDRHWAIRYLVADTGAWLPLRKVLISPYALGLASDAEQQISVNLTKRQIEESPSLASHKPVSRQFEDAYHRYHEWPMYYGGSQLWGTYPTISHERAPWKEPSSEKGWDPNLQSSSAIKGYHVHATDAEIGHVEDYLIEDETWAIRYLVIDTSNWWLGKKVLLSPAWVERVSWQESQIFIQLDRERIKQAPEYTSGMSVTREYEAKLHEHYQRSGYWVESPAATVADGDH